MSGEWASTLTLCGIYGVIAIATQLGLVCGAFSLAPVGWMAVGAYSAGLAATRWHTSLALGLLAAILIAAAFGPIIMLPVTRIAGLYFALSSLAFVLVVQAVFSNIGYTGGQEGIYGVPLTTNLALVVVALIAAMVIAWLMSTGRSGRALRAAGQDSVVAGSLGVNVMRYRLFVGEIGAILGVVGGFLYAGYVGYIDPTQFGFTTVVQVTAMVIVGGRRSWVGSVLGAFLITGLPIIFASLANYGDVFSGLLLVIVVVLEPDGLIGILSRGWNIARRFLGAWHLRRNGVTSKVAINEKESQDRTTAEARARD